MHSSSSMHLLALQLPTTLRAAMSMFSRASSCATGAEHHCGLSALSEFCIVPIFQHAKARLVVFGLCFFSCFLQLVWDTCWPWIANLVGNEASWVWAKWYHTVSYHAKWYLWQQYFCIPTVLTSLTNIANLNYFVPISIYLWSLRWKRKLRGVSLCVFSKCRWCGDYFTGRNETTKTKMTINGVYLDHGHNHDRKLKLQ